MSLKTNEILSMFVEALDKSKDKTKPYDSTAEVVRVDGDTVWVHIPSGVDETPVKKTINCVRGDRVQVRISGGTAWIVGNITAPPTDDSVAIQAISKSVRAELSARQALGMANEAYSKSVEAENEFASAVVTINGDIENLQDQIDGNITTWFYNYEPTASNLPASGWSDEEKNNHLGDLFYDTSTGYAYRWMVENGVYSWSKITDTDVTTALANASKAQDTADAKRRVFINTPTVPYDVGDLWCVGSSGDILTCTRAKTSIQSYSASDWSKLNKYTDDSAFTAFRDGTYAQFVTSTTNGLDSKITTYYQTSAPTTTIVGDLWIDTDDGNKLYRWNGSSWTDVQDDAIQAALTNASNAQSTADGKIRTFAQASAPTGMVAGDVGDLWIDTDDNNKMYRWSGTQWVAYTDTSALSTFISGTYATDKTNLQGQIDGKAETWYQSTDPSTAWNTTALKTQHKGDLWYNTSTDTTWYWSGTAWQQQNIPTAVFDQIDGKAQIFTSQPTAPYNVGDLWFDSNTSDIMVCTTSRASGNYTASDWEKRDKYTDDMQAVNASIKAEDAQKDVDATSEAVSTLSGEISNLSTALNNYEASNNIAIAELSNDITASAEQMTSRIGTAEEQVETLNASLSVYDGFIEIKENVPSITLGKRNASDVKTKVEITGASVNLWTEDRITAYASGQTFRAPEGSFENISMTTQSGVGNLMWIARSNGHLSLKAVN